MTISDVADQLEWSAAKISRIENARVSVLPRDVKFLLGIYSPHNGDDRDRLLDLASRSRQKAWWHQHGLTVPGWLQSYAAIEAEAATLRSYNPKLVPDPCEPPATTAPSSARGQPRPASRTLTSSPRS